MKLPSGQGKRKKSQTRFSSIPHQTLADFLDGCAHDRQRYRKKRKKRKKVSQSCLTLCDPMGIVHGILQARILAWVAFPFCRGSSQPRDNPGLPRCRRILYQLSHQGSTEVQRLSQKDLRSETEPWNKLSVHLHFDSPAVPGQDVCPGSSSSSTVFIFRTWGWTVFVNKRGRAQGHMVEEMCMMRWLAWRGGCPFSDLLCSVQEYSSNCPPCECAAPRMYPAHPL